MKTKPRISVIIPAYNSAAYVAETIQSVLDQDGLGKTYDAEIIVIDDGSTDTTGNIVAEFGDQVHYERITNSGRPSVPRNIGAKIATGEYLAFLDADDIWLPTKLQHQLAQFSDNSKLALVSSNASRIDEAGRDLGGLVVVDELQPPRVDLESLIKLNFICTSATMVKADVFRALGGFNESMELRAVEDYELWMRLAATNIIAYQHQALVLYRVHDAATSKHSEKEGWTLMLSVYTSFKKAVGKTLDRRTSIALAQQLLNARHDLVVLSGPLGKVRHGLAYIGLFIWLRIEYLKNK